MNTTVNGKYLGISRANYTECLSIGAKCYELHVNNDVEQSHKKKKAKKLDKQPIITKFLYYLIVFEISFKKQKLVLNHIGPSTSILSIKLKNGYLASDGAPKMEKNIKAVNIKYTYGSKVESASTLKFKLGWECKDVPIN